MILSKKRSGTYKEFQKHSIEDQHPWKQEKWLIQQVEKGLNFFQSGRGFACVSTVPGKVQNGLFHSGKKLLIALCDLQSFFLGNSNKV